MTRAAPQLRDDEEMIIRFVADYLLPEELRRIAAAVTKDDMVAAIEAYIRRGRTETERVIADAKAGDELAHSILHKLFHDMLDADEMPSVTLREYAKHPPRRRKPGRRSGWDKWFRNVATIMVIVHVSEFFGLNPTREQDPLPGTILPPSGCSIVKAALERLGDHKSERTVQNMYFSVAGVIGQWWAAEGGLHAHVRTNLERAWPQLVSQGRAYLTRLERV